MGGGVKNGFRHTEYGRVYRLLFLTVSGYRYLGDGGTDRREILHDMCPGCVFSPFGGGTPGIPQSKILAL